MVIDEAHSLYSWPVKMPYGKVNAFLYKVADASYDLFELRGMDDKPGKLYFIRKDGETEIVRIDHQNLKNFISSAFSDCPNVVQKSGRYNYNFASMLSLLSDVENCKGTDRPLEILKPQKKKQKYLLAEGNFSFGKYRFPDFYIGIDSFLLSSYSAGIRLEGKIGRVSYGSGLYFEHSGGSFNNVEYLAQFGITGKNLDISLNRVQLIPYFRYWFDTGKISFIPEFGIINNFHFSSSFKDDNLLFYDLFGNPYTPIYKVNLYGIGIQPGISVSFPIFKNILMQPGYRFVLTETEFKQVPTGFAASSDIYEIKHQIFVTFSIWRK